jgi:heavy metal sensor kinase
MNIHSLRFRMALLYAGVLGTCLILFGASVYLGLSSYLARSLENSVLDDARSIGEKILVDANRKGDAFVVGEMNEMDPEITGRFLRITRSDHSVLYVSPAPLDRSFTPAAISPVSTAVRGKLWREEHRAGGSGVRIVALPYVNPGGGSFLVEVGASTAAMDGVLRRLRLTLLVGVPLIIAGALVSGYLMMKRALRPLDRIAQRAEKVSSRNFGERLPVVRSGDEIEQLTTALNRMMERLEESFHHISRFSADVSHELRTPLAILRGELESVAERQQLSTEMLETIGSALEEIERVTRIVNHLLEISRLEAGQAVRERVLIDLGQLVTNTAEQMRLLAEEKSISVLYLIASHVEVEGDSLLLKQVVVNLLDNAIKYTPPQGSVRLMVEAREKYSVLEVQDTGVGISPQDLPHICERFYRADKARSRNSGGAGLGLSIVKSICAVFGGEIKIFSKEGEGTRVRIQLPRAVGNKAVPIDTELLLGTSSLPRH